MSDSKTCDEKVYSKNQLWIRISIVLVINLALIIIWLFTEHNDSTFIAHFSFASTVTSIVLSVLAIFMSVSGEMKTQAIRDRIEREADEIVTATDKMEKRMNELSGKMQDIKYTADDIKASVINPPTQVRLATGNGTAILEKKDEGQ